jgi:DNA-binding XRE family transcriptional regulator
MTVASAQHKLEVMSRLINISAELDKFEPSVYGVNFGHWLDFHSMLLDARIELGLTQQQLADRLGVTQPAISAFEDGSTGIKIQTILSYASALGLELQLSVKPVEKYNQPS